MDDLFEPDILRSATNSPYGQAALSAWSMAERWADRWGLDFDPGSANEPLNVTKVEDGFIVSFPDLARFHLGMDTRRITPFDISSGTSNATLIHLLFDQIAPRILAHKGLLVLHGSAVEIAGEAVVFLGETGMGKSTLAASLDRAGHRLLGDDAVIVTNGPDGYRASAVYPSLRLYPDTIAETLGAGTKVSQMAHYSDKQRVDLAERPDASSDPLPLSAVFFISGDTEAHDPAARKIGPAQACIRALEQSFSLDAKDRTRAADRLEAVSGLIGATRTFELDLPHDYGRLGEVRRLIEGCLAGRDAGAGKAD
jgi:energy-coupling factor transporter ATP-binding protein EcfA2